MDLPPVDHPRSRGVYGRQGQGYMLRFGSSPLARGLHTPAPPRVRLTRIIPARAGFTGREVVALIHSSDHPRSRGVYAATRRLAVRIQGSSPLARGLHAHGHARAARARIIPARAGFTGTPHPSPHPSRDHPRSRGVYKRLRIML